jgi:hypothetical protein
MGEESIYGDGPASVVGGLSALYGATGLVGRTLKTAFPKKHKSSSVQEKLLQEKLLSLSLAPLLGVPLGMAESSTRQIY